jgi:hypothetical protein
VAEFRVLERSQFFFATGVVGTIQGMLGLFCSQPGMEGQLIGVQVRLLFQALLIICMESGAHPINERDKVRASKGMIGFIF